MNDCLALDIGGANIKLADGRGFARSTPFALWKTPSLLASQISQCLQSAPVCGTLAVTMTGELADCFETKDQGVQAIVAAVTEASAERQVWFYQTNGEFVTADTAGVTPLLTAASNWHALATFVLRYTEGSPAVLIDVGSTTTDIVPLMNGQVACRGTTDPERLLTGELVYTGVERSPVCAITSQLPWRGTMCPVAQEFFATSGDAYLLLGELPEAPNDCQTADGKPFTRSAAHTRLARMICGDRELITVEEARVFAEAIFKMQLTMLERGYRKVVGNMPCAPDRLILSGHGKFLARRMIDQINASHLPTISLRALLGPDVSRCATAHAVAVLARDESTT